MTKSINFVFVAKLIINGRNESVKPCDDFYSYVCGNWSNNYQIPENSKFIDVRTMAEMKLKTLVKGEFIA